MSSSTMPAGVAWTPGGGATTGPSVGCARAAATGGVATLAAGLPAAAVGGATTAGAAATVAPADDPAAVLVVRLGAAWLPRTMAPTAAPTTARVPRLDAVRRVRRVRVPRRMAVSTTAGLGGRCWLDISSYNRSRSPSLMVASLAWQLAGRGRSAAHPIRRAGPGPASHLGSARVDVDLRPGTRTGRSPPGEDIGNPSSPTVAATSGRGSTAPVAYCSIVPASPGRAENADGGHVLERQGARVDQARLPDSPM